jgi:hypothetical protein
MKVLVGAQKTKKAKEMMDWKAGSSSDELAHYYGKLQPSSTGKDRSYCISILTI